jgi:hypothetical protein
MSADALRSPALMSEIDIKKHSGSYDTSIGIYSLYKVGLLRTRP